MNSAVLLDLDGTLLDTERLFTSCLIRSASNSGVEMTWETACKVVGMNEIDSRAFLKSHFGQSLPIDVIEKEAFSEFYSTLDKDVPLKAGAEHLISMLVDLSVPFAVATARATLSARRLLDKTTIGKRCVNAYGGDLVVNSKPAPDIFLYAAEQIEIEPHKCIVVEDSEAGIKAALAAQCQVIAIPDIGNIAEDILANCYSVSKTLHEASDHLKQLLSK